MTKTEMITIIMNNTTEHKKSHLAKMLVDEVAEIAAPFIPADDTEVEQSEAVASEAEEVTLEADTANYDEGPAADESAQDEATAPAEDEAPTPVEYPDDMTPEQLVEALYNENKSLVKGSRINKEEFKATAIAKTLDVLAGTETSAEIRAAVVQTITDLMAKKAAFLPINDTEQKMLATLPKMPEFKDTDSKIVGKDWLDMVETLHNIPVSSTRALMVALRKKGFIWIIGKKSGEKITTVHLLERGIKYLKDNGLLPVDTEEATVEISA